MKSFAETFASKATVPDEDDTNAEAYNRPPPGMVQDPRDRKPTFDLYKVDYKWIEN